MKYIQSELLNYENRRIIYHESGKSLSGNVFGSAATGDLAEASDLDFLVIFKRAGYEGAFDQFMGFKETLEKIYNKPVDLFHNDYFRNSVFEEELNRTKKLLYAA